jgi:iron complex outermembrane receptor protein
MKIEITSVSKKAERAGLAAAAVEVISSEDIRRSGAVTLPEVLRLSFGLFVGQANGRMWAISARGFTTTLANKLLVMLDGRSVYYPFFGGVFWDNQDLLLDDVDRIEVIRGPGATLWGANAVNGVINIITKNAKDTQGRLLKAGSGSGVLGIAAARYGGTIGAGDYYRIYSKYHYQGALRIPDGASAHDPLRLGQLGFRTDWESQKRASCFWRGDQTLRPARHQLFRRLGSEDLFGTCILI